MRLPAPLSRRPRRAHKNQFGHVLVIAGSERYLGAAALTALAAMRGGAGLTTLAVPRSLNLTAQRKISPVIMTCPLPETKRGGLSARAAAVLRQELSRIQSLAVGPGLGQREETGRFLKRLATHVTQPSVWDADALNLCAKGWFSVRDIPGPKILTPHPGEMARLVSRPKSVIEADPERWARSYARAKGCILLLKGHPTLIAAPGGRVFRNRTGNPGMATAGSGDVLTGLLAAFLAQGMEPFAAAGWGAYIHGRAGDLAVRKVGEPSCLATDILEMIPAAIRSARSKNLRLS